MYNGNSGRRQRGRRGGKREFGDSQGFGSDFSAPDFLMPNQGYSKPAGGEGETESFKGGGDYNNRFQQSESKPVERGPRQHGTVKFFKEDKGFGFITPDGSETDVFVHISAVERSGLGDLSSGQRISFETEPDRRGKGPKAVELRLEEENTSEAS
ncbi:cold-shock protein [Flexibacterium corallicola]|uniref:cold-shock protein n=1 Tax=Flexibacterium corallicola TaxID=3037259 RepID=UPI00286FA25A|nr:cold-shock protein [Pseudovibrio sp. M1P-2-3]